MGDKSNLKRHIQAVHMKKVAKTCEICGKDFVHINLYKYHIILEEPEHSCYAICADCGNKLKKFAIFRATCINNNERFRQLSKPRKQLCTICGKLIINMQNHILSHTKEQKFACSYCPMKCSRKTQLKLHIDAVHLKKIVQKCEICNRGFTHVTSYTAHMRAQHGVGESYECKACGIKFRHRGGLRGHNNRKHNDESNCKCPICGMQFQDKKGLKCHFRVHSTEKPFACKYCPKRFKGPYARRVHELTHSGIMFQCTLCDKSYRYKALFNDHMRKCHGEKDAKLTKQC
ncbi:zinc finger protein 596-like [Anopheles nili]|uniref:zinc finger protein 596-like n=1 Tax=Anopheles nili TaxID=185578 RepID=UPI00237C0958|nr:zinc finger protein 596-like [Anopheles nili]